MQPLFIVVDLPEYSNFLQAVELIAFTWLDRDAHMALPVFGSFWQ